MRLLQTPARAFAQTRVHSMRYFLVRKTLQMMVGMNNCFYGDKYANCDKYNNDAI
jgi:hypothetical protein